MDDPLFWPALEFYVESFPREEREPLHEIATVASGRLVEAGRATGHYRHFAGAELEGRLAGFRYFSADVASQLGFFIYLAVEPAFRKLGIGSALIDFGIAQCKSDLESHGVGINAIFFECERPWLVDGEERDLRERRLGFFKNRGALMVSDTYVQPSLADDREEVPLILMAYPFADKIDWPKSIAVLHRTFLGLEPESEAEKRTIAGVKL